MFYHALCKKWACLKRGIVGTESGASSKKRFANWDILRSLAMFLVVVVHCNTQLGFIADINASTIVRAIAITCDPLFFALSGYFAIVPLKRSLTDYYLNKVCTILLPLFVYSLIIYFYATGLNDVSLGDYFTFFAEEMAGGWWFIPALVPSLVVAPFIGMTFEKFSKNTLRILVKILIVLYAWGAFLSVSSWLFSALEIETLSAFTSLVQRLIPPSVLSSQAAYFQFFVLGGLLRWLMPQMSSKLRKTLIAAGIFALVIEVVFEYFGGPVFDPSYWWLFIVIGVFVWFDGMKIASSAASKVFSWTAQRSYSIYLVQYTAIGIMSKLIYDQSVFGIVANMGGIMRLLFWVVFVLLSYALSLGVVSVIDTILLKPLQSWFRRVAMGR